ncbi:MAG TPA: 4Fe-4S binding protein [Thermoanaerobacterales bacterium]|nr:4Fe-4S binding protein [Thermoanaerobacterales bacterium]
MKEDFATQVIINEKWCKGCGICVEFCKPKVINMKNDKAVPAHPERCTKCMLCEIRCPDFAITIGGGAI